MTASTAIVARDFGGSSVGLTEVVDRCPLPERRSPVTFATRSVHFRKQGTHFIGVEPFHTESLRLEYEREANEGFS